MNEIDKSSLRALHPKTQLIQAGRHPDEQFGFINTPIYRGSTVLYPSAESLRKPQRFTYGTKGTPSTSALEEAWCLMAKAAGTVLTSSGLAALTLALLTVVKKDCHILVTDSVYKPTRDFCNTILKRLGVTITYYNPCLSAAELKNLFRPETCVLLLESPGSQTFEIQDVPALSQIAHAHNICVILDNTWATPLYFPGHEKGVDLMVEAGTKYLSGHSDSLLGLVSANSTWWPHLRATFDAFAMCAGPEDVFLALRGLRTLDLRLRESGQHALLLAQWLQERPEVQKVLHPALPSHPGHAIWARDFKGSSGLFSIILSPVEPASVDKMLNSLTLFGLGYSWGGYESLILPFDCTSYRTATPWTPSGPALRLYIGLEDPEDLQKDLDQAFRHL